MSSTQDIDQMRERFIQLRQQGYSLEQAIQLARTLPRATRIVQPSAEALTPEGVDQAPTKSLAESAGRGAAQGATVGFGDEIQGLVQAVGNRVLPVSMGGRSADEQQPSFVQDYRNERDAARATNEEARRSHPVGYTASEIGGSLVTAPLTKAGKGVGGALKAGAKIGAVIGLGNSKADLTAGKSAEYLRAAGDTSLGALIGAGAGGVGYGIGKAIGAVGRAISNAAGGETAAVNNAAQDIANNVAENAGTPSALQGEGTVESAFRNSDKYVDNWSKMLESRGEGPLALPASKMTGDRASALAEQRLQQFGPTMNAAQATEAKLVEQTGKILDMHVENIAADPAKLGRGEIADQLANVLDKHISSIYKAGSQIAGPMYDKAAALGGDVPSSGIVDTINGAIADNSFNHTQMAGTLQNVLREAQDTSASGTLSLDAANGLRKLMLKTIGHEAAPFGNAPASVQERIARNVLNSVDEAMDEAAAQGNAPGVEWLRQANAAWRASRVAAEDATTKTVRTILDKAGTDAAETIPRQLLSLQPRQVEGVFRILNAQADQSLAHNVRAQMFQEALSAAGAPQAGSVALENGVNRFSPAQAMTQFYKAEPALRAAYAGDNKALHALADTFQLLKRVNFGPGLKGSPTYAYAADDAIQGLAASGAEKMANAVAPGSGGVMRAVLDKVGSIFSDPSAAAKAVSTPEGIQAVNKALRIALQNQGGRVAPTAATAKAAAQIITELTSIIGREQPQPEEPPSDNPRGYAQQ